MDTSQNNCNISNPVSYLCNLLNMQSLINKPTRVTANSSTIIDHIITSVTHNHSESDVIEVTFSDHYLVYSVLKFKSIIKTPRTVEVRCFKNFNQHLFLMNLSKALDTFMLNPPTDLETAWCTWAYIFTNICNMYVPMKKYRVKSHYNP